MNTLSGEQRPCLEIQQRPGHSPNCFVHIGLNIILSLNIIFCVASKRLKVNEDEEIENCDRNGRRSRKPVRDGFVVAIKSLGIESRTGAFVFRENLGRDLMPSGALPA